MFDSLLGSKFSKKCKYCVKCINSRVVLIRKKKQATVKFLKKDVADLLANGHDSIAFGRIEALIAEINLTSCYDMIEIYCQCILDQLPCLQKQRECPEEATEAVATLIFATARFSDLPELFDLRRIFTERYGSHMESYVNAEFVEKLQKKSFSTDRKIRLMQDIAEEFSVSWDSKAFRRRQTIPPAQSSDQPKSRSSNKNEPCSHAEINQRNTAVSQRNEAVFDAAGRANGRNTAAALNAAASANRRKEAMFKADGASNERDSAVLNARGSFNGRKEVVLNADIAVNGRAETGISSRTAVNGRDRSLLNGSSGDGRKEVVIDACGSFTGRKEVVLNADIAVNGRQESGIDSNFGVNRRNEAALSAGDDQELQSKVNWETPRARFLQRQQVQPEPRDIHVIPSTRNGRLHDPAGSTGKVRAAAKETVNVEPGCGSADGYAYAKVSQNNTHDGDCVLPKVSLNGIHKDARSRLPRAQEGPGLIGLEKPSVAPMAVSSHMKTVNIPPYSKLKGFAYGSGAMTNSVQDSYDLPGAEEVLEPSSIVQERTTLPVKNWRGDARPMSMIPPPYTKPNFKNSLTPSDDSKFTDTPPSTAECEMSNCSEKDRPVSVRRRLPKPTPVIEADSSSDNAKHIKHDSYGEVFGEHQRKAAEEDVHGQRRHGGRRSTAMYNGVFDDEEAAMDRLLVHYSKKGVDIDPSKRRTRMRAPPEETVIDSGRGAVELHYDDRAHHGNGRINHSTTETARHRPDRVASIPTVPVIEVGVGIGPARATSMHPDFMSSNGGRVQPDYDDLTARFIALKNS